MSLHLFYELGIATLQTLYMVFISTLLVVIFGLPLGTWLFGTRSIFPKALLYKVLSMIINAVRSIPFIILMVALIPFTRFIVGTSIGMHAAMVPLVLGAVPYFARLADNVYINISNGLLETGSSMGMSSFQIIRYLLLPEATPALIQATTVTAITLVNYTAMAGVVGGGGLGDFAIRFGYQRFDPAVMVLTVIVLIIMVQGMQMIGDRLALMYEKR